MNTEEISKKLQSFESRIIEMIRAWDEKHENFESFIQAEHECIKNELKSEKERYRSDRLKESASEAELSFYYPAVNEGWLELKTRTGIRPNQRIISELASASSQISYWISEMER